MHEILKDLLNRNSTKLVMCVLDGLGGLPLHGRTELEAANTPNLDRLARKGATGLHIPVAPGITPGSGAAHLGLFGYDPLRYTIGRGVLEALGLGIELTKRDVAVRGNYATVRYENGTPILVDRRAGRIATPENRRITSRIGDAIKEIDGVVVKITPGMEHRFALVLTFPEPLPVGSDEVKDTDPQAVGVPPLPPLPKATHAGAAMVARVLEQFIGAAARILREEDRANYLLLRGVSIYPDLPGFEEVYGLNPAAIASYPMYRGVAKLVGMNPLSVEDTSIEGEIVALEKEFQNYDFFFLHVKKTDSYGEDGNFDAKVGVIEEFDSLIPRILELDPDVLVVTGDHSTPSVMKSHSWHPVPILLSSKLVRGGFSNGFSESECLRGELGMLRAIDIMPLMLAHSGRLQKFGA
jgi:2,3-bisphosphoglycerate-independent phosphoglycerate mutase